MPLFTGTQQQYYNNSWTQTGNGSTTAYTLPFDPKPASVSDFRIFFNEVEQDVALYDATAYNSTTGVVTFDSAPANGVIILFEQVNFDESLGNYQHIKIDEVINNFIISYVGQDKIIPKIKRTDIAFHVQRGIQELSYDTLRSEKSQEIEIPPSLKMKLPHDYVNYVKLSWKDSSGVERILYPARKTSNPTALLQDGDYNYQFDANNELLEAYESDTWDTFKSQGTGDESESDTNQNAVDQVLAEGRRYGISPEESQGNGVFFIDNTRGYIHVSSDITGKTITLKYISDGLAVEGDMLIHKFAEDAIYKYVAHAVLSSRSLVPEYLVARFKKEKFAATRKAKIRLSNLKAEEITQVLRNKSKVIKH